MAVNDELAAFHNHTNFGKDTQRAFLFAGASYADIIEELKRNSHDLKLPRACFIKKEGMPADFTGRLGCSG